MWQAASQKMPKIPLVSNVVLSGFIPFVSAFHVLLGLQHLKDLQNFNTLMTKKRWKSVWCVLLAWIQYFFFKNEHIQRIFSFGVKA